MLIWENCWTVNQGRVKKGGQNAHLRSHSLLFLAHNLFFDFLLDDPKQRFQRVVWMIVSDAAIAQLLAAVPRMLVRLGYAAWIRVNTSVFVVIRPQSAVVTGCRFWPIY